MTTTDDKLAELEPCPFCGNSKRVQVAEFAGEPYVPGYFVRCNASGIDGHPRKGCGASSGWAETPEAAIAAWNRRASSAREKARLEMMANSRDKLHVEASDLITRLQASEAREKALREALEWRPIETAPKDGTPFIALNHDLEVWVSRIDEHDRLQFRTNGRHEPRSFEVKNINGEKWMKEDEEYANANEQWRNEWCLWSRLYEFKPTHWLPLPKPLATLSQGETL